MMQANELKIGNLLDYLIVDKFDERKEWYEETTIDYEDIRLCVDSNDYFNKHYAPIPITEEWLLKLGFVSNPYQDRYEIGKDIKLHVECDKTKGEVMLWIEDLSHIKYVHQLQNLYYIMFYEELTINQP